VEGRRQRSGDRGGSRLNMILTLLILGSMVFAGAKVIPAYFANFQFQDAIESEARFAIANKKDADEIQADVWRKAQDLSIPLGKKEDIKVMANQASISIATDYSVAVDLIVYQFSLQFHPHADNHTI
jgi:Domain of unknown function (DUF4845)